MELRAKTNPVMATEAAWVPWHFAAASQSILFMPMPGMLSSSGISLCWKKKKVIVWIDDWYFNPQVACGGRSQHQWANRDCTLLNMQEGFPWYWTESLGRGKKPHMQLNPQETGHQYVRGQEDWCPWRMVLWGHWCDLNRDWKVQCGSSEY